VTVLATEGEDAAPADPEGTLSFEHLEARMRENSLDLLTLEQTILAIESLDYEEMKDEIRDGLNAIADAQWGMISSIPMLGSMMAGNMQSSYDSLRATFDDLKEGKLQADNADLVRQLENAQNQIIMVGENLYIQSLTMANSAETLERNLAALDRNIAVAELSVKQGNLAQLTLEEARSGRASLVSGQQSLEMGRELLALQLQSMVGEELTGDLTLAPLPKVEQADLDAMEEQTDLEQAKAASYSLHEAQVTYEDAEEAYKDAVDEYGEKSTEYQFTQAKHTWKSAQLSYQSAHRNFELSFRTLYRQVKDYEQVLEAAKSALEFQKKSYAASELKYEQGRISRNALLDAADQLATAEEKVTAAETDLFVGYNNYRWAVDHGILN